MLEVTEAFSLLAYGPFDVQSIHLKYTMTRSFIACHKINFDLIFKFTRIIPYSFDVTAITITYFDM